MNDNMPTADPIAMITDRLPLLNPEALEFVAEILARMARNPENLRREPEDGAR